MYDLNHVLANEFKLTLAITKVEKMDKTRILQEIMAVLQKYTHQIESSIMRYKLAVTIDEDDILDPEDLSHQAEASDLLLRFKQLLLQAKKQEQFLLTHGTNKTDCISPGALVETKSHYIYIGISVPAFKFNGKTVVTLSEKAPAYHNMREKKVGEIIELGEHYLKIITIH